MPTANVAVSLKDTGVGFSSWIAKRCDSEKCYSIHGAHFESEQWHPYSKIFETRVQSLEIFLFDFTTAIHAEISNWGTCCLGIHLSNHCVVAFCLSGRLPLLSQVLQVVDRFLRGGLVVDFWAAGF